MINSVALNRMSIKINEVSEMGRMYLKTVDYSPPLYLGLLLTV